MVTSRYCSRRAEMLGSAGDGKCVSHLRALEGGKTGVSGRGFQWRVARRALQSCGGIDLRSAKRFPWVRPAGRSVGRQSQRRHRRKPGDFMQRRFAAYRATGWRSAWERALRSKLCRWRSGDLRWRVAQTCAAWSPEQIVGLKQQFPTTETCGIHEAIYRFFVQTRGVLKRSDGTVAYKAADAP